MVPAVCRREEYDMASFVIGWLIRAFTTRKLTFQSFFSAAMPTLVTDMLLAILNTCSKEELDEDDMILNLTDGAAGAMEVDPAPLTPAESNQSPVASADATSTASATGSDATAMEDTDMADASRALAEKQASKNRIRQKILAVARLSRMYAVLRNESEAVSELKDLMGTTKLPYGSLALGAEGLKKAIHSFDDAKKSDQDNERLPPSKEEKV